MERPASIIWFERAYLAAVFVGIGNTLLQWPMLTARVEATPGGAMLGPWFLPGSIVIGLAISLLLWFFAARKGAVVAKWIVTVFFAISVVSLPTLFATVRQGLISPAMTVAPIIAFALHAVAVWMLFRPDAKPWFSRDSTDLKDTFS